jgi:DNA-binding response OmpR family regulator
MAHGEELIIAEGTQRDRDGLRKLFEDEGFVCTVPTGPEQARDLLRRKFFPIALIDLDYGGTNEGLALASYIEQHSRPTKIVMLTARRSYDAVVKALRAGVIDVVFKQPEQIEQLRGAMVLALDRYHAGSKDSVLLREARALMDEAILIMLGLGRKLYDGDPSSGSGGLKLKPAILIVDEDQAFLQKLADLLRDKPWDVSIELRGGAGLDRASSFGFQIVVVRDELADLPGQMLLRSCQGQPQAPLGLLYSQRGNGRIDRYEGGQVKSTDGPFRGPEHLVATLARAVDDLATLREERRYLQGFRAEHGPFFKRYAELKARIDSLSG